MTGMVLYAFWEITSLLLGIAIALWCFHEKHNFDDVANFWLVALIGKIFISCLILQILVLTKCVSPFSLMVIACISGVSGLIACLKHANTFQRAFFRATSFATSAWLYALVIASTVLLSTSFVPLIEVDSLNVADAIYHALVNSISVFDFPYHYVAFWEMGYIPGLILTKTTFTHPLFSVQAIILFVLTVYCIAKMLNATRLSCALLTFSCLLCGHFWTIAPTGVATLKNDIISNAGVLIVLYATLHTLKKDSFERYLAVLFAGGIAFSCTKFSGLPIALVLAVLVCAIRPSTINVLAHHKFTFFFICITFLVSSGIYYAVNFYYYHNPLYPFALNFWTLHLNGDMHIEKTRILDYFFKLKTWRYFLGIPLTLRATGIFFPAIMFAFIFIPPLVFIHSYHTDQQDEPSLVAWIFTAFLWGYFFCLPWSAGSGAQSPYSYLSAGHSFRYTLASLELSLLLSCIALQRTGWFGEVVSYALIVGHLIGQYAFIISWMKFSGAALASFAIIVAIIDLSSKRHRGVMSIVLVCFLSSIFLAPTTYAHNQINPTGAQYYPIDEYPYGTIYKTAANLSWEPADGISHQFGMNPPATTGSEMQFKYGGVISLREITAGGIPEGKLPGALVATTLNEAPFSKNEIILIQDMLCRSGYVLAAPSIAQWFLDFDSRTCTTPKTEEQDALPWSLVFFKVKAALKNESPPIEAIPLLNELPHSLFTKNSLNSDGGLTGRYFATITPAGLWRREVGQLISVRIPPRAQVSLYRSSPSGRPGRAVPFVLSGAGWSLAPNASRSSLFSKRIPFIENGALNQNAWFVTGVGGYVSRVITLDGRPALEISLQKSQPWIGLFTRPSVGEGAPGHYILYLEVLANRALTLNLHGSSFAPDGTVKPLPFVRIPLPAQLWGCCWFMFDSSTSLKNAFDITWKGHAGDVIVLKNVLLFKTEWPLGIGLEGRLIKKS